MKNIINELNILKNNILDLPTIDINSINLSKTQLFIVDMNNGFAKSGTLYSPRIESLIKPIADFTNHVSDKIQGIIAFTDCHTKDSIELLSYPTHCLENDFESEIVDELKSIKNINIVSKNSTNGFFALDNTDFHGVENIIIVGDCTDICVYQLAITLKSYFNQNNINKNIIIPTNLVDTYNIEEVHNAELLNIVFLNSLIQNGVQVVKNINY